MSRFPWIFPALLLGACTVAEDPYPLRWDPLPPAPAADCRHFAGTYADRGESPAHPSKPSLTRELFGSRSPWQKATNVHVGFPTEDEVEVTVALSEGAPYVRRFAGKAGEFSCDRGHMALSNRRWVASDVMSGRETVRVELHHAGQHLAAQVSESLTGVMFMLVPLSGESVRWYRFARLKP